MKNIKQFRWGGTNNPINYPSTLNRGALIKGNIFKNHIVSQLGIQGVPGTKIYLNNSLYPIEIGYTGIYELNLENYSQIYAIHFDESSIDLYENKGVHLLIDILYEGGS